MIRKSSQDDRRPPQQYPIDVYGYLVGMQRSWSQALLCGIQWQNKKQWIQTETQEIPFKIRNTLFVVRIVKHCHRLPREVIETPVPEMFKTQLYTVCGSLLWASRDLDWIIAKGPSSSTVLWFWILPPRLDSPSLQKPASKTNPQSSGAAKCYLQCFSNEISLLKYSSFKICHNRCYF